MKSQQWDDWWEIAQEDESATFFHSPLWAQIAKVQGYEPAPQFSNENRDTVLPAVKSTKEVTKFGMSKSITQVHSTFATCYGGVISKKPTVNQDSIHSQVKQSADIVRIVENPISERDPPEWNQTEDFTQLIDLSMGFDKVKEGFTKSRQQGINNARESNVTIRKATSLEDWKVYHEAYEDSLERWDNPTSNYGWQLFECLHGLQQEYPENISLWLSCINDQIASGAVVFYWNNHVDYWHAASFSDYFEYNPNDLLQAKLIEDAAESGYRWYDFNPSGGHEGVVQFKSEFGPTKECIIRASYIDPKLKVAKKFSSR
jgi:hypothetical protein